MWKLIIIIILSSSICYADTTTGLSAWWKLDENSGTTAIDSSGSNTGTITGSPPWIGGKIRSAIQFNNSVGYYITIGNSSTIRTSPMTMCAWIYPFTSGTRDAIIYNGNGDAFSTNNYIFGINSTSTRLTFFGRTPSSQLFSNNGAYTLNIWNHVCFSADGANINFYSNGSSAGSSAGTVGTDNTFGSDIGVNSGTVSGRVNPFNGIIDDVRIYNRALSAVDITQLYNIGIYGHKINNSNIKNMVIN